jgi:hypothetical protein
MNQPVATYTEEDFERILMRDYPGPSLKEAKEILGLYGKEKWQIGILRVQMACLKLAAGNVAELQKYVQVACGDFRDVLAWAEYPVYGRAKGNAEKEEAIKTDWAALQEWLLRG